MPKPTAPILYVRPGCTACLHIIGVLDRNKIDYELVDTSRRPVPAWLATQPELPLPALNWEGTRLRSLDVTQLIRFLKDRDVPVFKAHPHPITAIPRHRHS